LHDVRELMREDGKLYEVWHSMLVHFSVQSERASNRAAGLISMRTNASSSGSMAEQWTQFQAEQMPFAAFTHPFSFRTKPRT
jgi:hypothetical protein